MRREIGGRVGPSVRGTERPSRAGLRGSRLGRRLEPADRLPHAGLELVGVLLAAAERDGCEGPAQPGQPPRHRRRCTTRASRRPALRARAPRSTGRRWRWCPRPARARVEDGDHAARGPDARPCGGSARGTTARPGGRRASGGPSGPARGSTPASGEVGQQRPDPVRRRGDRRLGAQLAGGVRSEEVMAGQSASLEGEAVGAMARRSRRSAPPVAGGRARTRASAPTSSGSRRATTPCPWRPCAPTSRPPGCTTCSPTTTSRRRPCRLAARRSTAWSARAALARPRRAARAPAAHRPRDHGVRRQRPGGAAPGRSASRGSTAPSAPPTGPAYGWPTCSPSAARTADAVDVVFTGLDHGIERGVEQDYQRGLPLDDACGRDVLVAYEMNGAPLPVAARLPRPRGRAGLVRHGQREVAGRRSPSQDEEFLGYQNLAYRLKQSPDERVEPVTRIEPRALLAPPGLPRLHHPHPRAPPRAGAARGPGLVGLGPGDPGRGQHRRRRHWADADARDRQPGAWAWRGSPTRGTATPGEHRLRVRAHDATGRVQATDPPGTAAASPTTPTSGCPASCWTT